MPLSRLDNFIKNVRGNVIYVDPNSLDSTDSVTNQGNSLTRPFKTIQRALIEASRFSYQQGLDNDRFEKTTISLAPGEHLIDNRPGWIPTGSNTYLLRDGTTSTDLPPLSGTSNFDLNDPNNVLYKLNSISGGVVVPRGVSIVGQDLRKCKIRPLYVPDPENGNIERSAIFKITGGTYFYQFTLLDSNPNGNAYKNYTTTTYAPSFSHHKLTSFEYVDGANNVIINDAFISGSTGEFTRTDLDMYYEKVGLVYGPASGRSVEPDYPSSGLDIQAKVDEYRIVGPTSGSVGISSIRAGDGSTATDVITVNLSSGLDGLNVDTEVQIDNVGENTYNGNYRVTQVLTVNSDGETTSFTYEVPVVPTDALPSVTGSTATLSIDTVTGASPYIFNISMRSIYGMCGMHADGSKVKGFRSMVVAQFTGISLQVDDNAFVRYNTTSGSWDDSTTVPNLHSDSNAKYKPTYRNFHIKASNNSFIQLVSIFAIGFSEQFVTDSGGDFSVTNSNSNFGQIALRANGFRKDAFTKDDVGYITNLIPPRSIPNTTVNLEYSSIDVEKTVGVGSTSRLYLYGETNQDSKPLSVIQGYRFGAKTNDRLYALIVENGQATDKSARIIMPNTQINTANSDQISAIKSSIVGRSSGINSISSNTLTFKEDHSLLTGEKIRIISDNGRLPDGLDNNVVYFAITEGLNSNQLQFAQTYNEALSGTELTINNLGGTLTVQSRVSDKLAGDVGHPIQYDTTQNNWYINVATAATENNLYSTIVGLGTTALGKATSRTYIQRTPDNRSSADRTYRYRFVVPAGSGITSARPPQDSYVIQESNTVIGADDEEVALLYSPTTVTMDNSNELRNPSYISDAKYSGGTVTYFTEKRHNLSIGSSVEISNVTSTNFNVGTAKSGFNGTFAVTGITSAKAFTVSNTGSDPGSFTNNVSNRTTSLPTFKRKQLDNVYYLYRSNQVQEYVPGEKDGIYYLTILNSSNTPPVAPYNTNLQSFSQPVRNLFPQLDRDNPVSDPEESRCFANAEEIGLVDINDPIKSITKETLEKTFGDNVVGVGITNIYTNNVGTAVTIFTDYDHGLNRITDVTITNGGAGFGEGSGGTENLYNARLVNSTTGRNATARLTVDVSGTITDVKIMDGGSSYIVGDNLSVVGVATTTGYSPATIQVSKIYNNVGDTVRVVGITSDTLKEYNQLYRITSVTSDSEFNAAPVNTITGINTGVTGGIGVTVTSNSVTFVTGKALDISSLQYNSSTGLATVTTNQAHGFRANNSVVIGGATENLYNGEFVINQNVGLTTFIVDIGVSTTTPTVSGTLRAYPNGYGPQSSTDTIFEEDFAGRSSNIYAGITTTLSSSVTSVTSDELNLTNVDDLNIEIGDYFRIDDEIVRVKTTVTGNPVKVFRGLFGTNASTHESGSVIRRIRINPIELRRNSIARASGHTFEYIGFGPGNYSTAFPDKQNSQLKISTQLRAQSFLSNGGVNNYTGMNDKGDFYIGNKRISSVTGKEEVFDVPIQTVTGEDLLSPGITKEPGSNILDIDSGKFERSLEVGGGIDNNILSQFNGPVVFSEKLTSTSDDGIEANSIFLQGNAVVSRNYTVGVSTPTQSANPGDVVYNANPVKGGTIGWTYTLDKGWYPFGGISVNQNGDEVIFEKVGVGTTSIGDCTFKVGSGTSMVCIDADGVGIGTTANGTNLRVEGAVVATAFTGDGSGLTNLANDSLFTSAGTGYTGIYPINNLNVGIGTTQPDDTYTLHLGSPGTGKTDLNVFNKSRFVGESDFESVVTIGGTLNSTSFDLDSTSGRITSGIVTSTTINVGTSSTIFSATPTGVGIGTATPREKLDINGKARFTSYYEMPRAVTSSSGVVTLDLDLAQTFTITTTENITQFRILNPTASSTFAFTIKITQGSTPRSVGIDTFRDSLGNTINTYWPGGVVPVVTGVGTAVDVYSFMSFDGGSTLFGVIGGQNFS